MDFAKLHEEMVASGLAPKDGRVYLLVDLANGVLKGFDLDEVQRAKLAEFPYSLELLDSMAARRIKGGAGRVSATPGPDATLETFAKAWLGMEWELEHGHSHPIRMFDEPWGWCTDVRTMKRTFRVKWRALPTWLLDRIGVAAMHVRIFRDRRILKLSNPYN